MMRVTLGGYFSSCTQGGRAQGDAQKCLFALEQFDVHEKVLGLVGEGQKGADPYAAMLPVLFALHADAEKIGQGNGKEVIAKFVEIKSYETQLALMQSLKNAEARGDAQAKPLLQALEM